VKKLRRKAKEPPIKWGSDRSDQAPALGLLFLLLVAYSPYNMDYIMSGGDEL
jgi:hypothetical protein